MKIFALIIAGWIALNLLAAGIDWFAKTQSWWAGPLVLCGIIAACVYGIAKAMKE